MIERLLKPKKYNVVIMYNEKDELIDTVARTKKEAKEIVSNLLVRCNLFKANTPSEFQLKIRKSKKQ